AEAKSDKTFPSNSGIAKSGKRSRLFSKSPESSNGQNSEDILALRSFNAVAKITELLKQSHTEGFVTVLEKLLALVEDDNSTRRDAKYGFIENLLSNVLEGDMEGFVSAEQLFESKIGVIPERDLQVQLFDEEDIVRLKKLGSGESSIVTLGKVKTLDQKVALKRAKFSEWDQVIEDEINLLLNLKHDNILKLFGKHRPQPVMVVEFMDLGDLYSAVQVSNLLPKSRLCPETFYSYFTSKILVDNPKSRPSFTAIKAKLKEFAPSWTN
ncbi:hypothetical protein NQ315_007412, partial [Exocentrus adspersus]